MILLVPIIEYDKDTNEEIGVYTGLFNFEPSFIVTIEPDENGNTIIYQRSGGTIGLKIKCEDFIKFIATRITIDVGLLHEVAKYDKPMQKIINTMLKEQEQNRTDDSGKGNSIYNYKPE